MIFNVSVYGLSGAIECVLEAVSLCWEMIQLLILLSYLYLYLIEPFANLLCLYVVTGQSVLTRKM